MLHKIVVLQVGIYHVCSNGGVNGVEWRRLPVHMSNFWWRKPFWTLPLSWSWKLCCSWMIAGIDCWVSVVQHHSVQTAEMITVSRPILLHRKCQSVLDIYYWLIDNNFSFFLPLYFFSLVVLQKVKKGSKSKLVSPKSMRSVDTPTTTESQVTTIERPTEDSIAKKSVFCIFSFSLCLFLSVGCVVIILPLLIF